MAEFGGFPALEDCLVLICDSGHSKVGEQCSRKGRRSWPFLFTGSGSRHTQTVHELFKPIHKLFVRNGLAFTAVPILLNSFDGMLVS
eukprot:255459-Amphidinium_carterae.1